MISTHTLTWSVTLCRRFNKWAVEFQLTRSRGAWHADETKFQEIVNFNSHAHVERDIETSSFYDGENKFQLTRSRGAWLEYSDSRGQTGNFNSHAHVERD